jgi:hypothetical protein
MPGLYFQTGGFPQFGRAAGGCGNQLWAGVQQNRGTAVHWFWCAVKNYRLKIFSSYRLYSIAGLSINKRVTKRFNKYAAKTLYLPNPGGAIHIQSFRIVQTEGLVSGCLITLKQQTYYSPVKQENSNALKN